MSNTPQFGDFEFVNASILNAALGATVANSNDFQANAFTPGLINNSGISISISGLVLSITFGSTTRALFSSGVLAGGYGTTNGATSTVYSVNLSSFVPVSGTQEVYVIATTTQIGQNAVLITGPTPGHPDYDPSFVPYTLYTDQQDSLSLSGTLAAPNNTTSLEICRVSLTTGQSVISAAVTSYQQLAGAVLSKNGEVSAADLAAGSAIANIGYTPAALNGSSTQVFAVATPTSSSGAVPLGLFYASDGGSTVNNVVLTLPGVTSYAQIGGFPVTFIITVTNTGPATLNINGLGAINILQGGAGLSGGELIAAWQYTVVIGSGSAHLIGSGAGAVNIGAATAATHAVRLGQAQAEFAYINGNISQVFNCANAASSTEAVTLGQFPVNFSGSGYQKLPSGLIIQWGSTTAGAPSSVTFPLTFPNACMQVLVAESNANSGSWGAGRPTVHGSQNPTVSGYTAWSETWNGSSWTGAANAQSYIAIGY